MMHLWPGVGDVRSLPGPRYFALASRVLAYISHDAEGRPCGTSMATVLRREMREAPAAVDEDSRTEISVEQLMAMGG